MKKPIIIILYILGVTTAYYLGIKENQNKLERRAKELQYTEKEFIKVEYILFGTSQL